MEKPSSVQTAAAALLLAALVFGAFGGALRCDFVRFDDPGYVFENPQVVRGLTPAGIRWAFTTGAQANWHPLTWLSHMADVELYGLAPAGHHLTSLLLHAANAILLFGVLRGLTGRFFLAWLAAALWAVHPLRVESVVWISERKDVLSTFFGLLALGAYGRVAARGRRGWTALFFALSLLAKPLWVTLPFLLLLLDVWPLRRWPGTAAGRLVKEKWPLFLLAAISCAATFAVQQRGGTVGSLDVLPLSARCAHAVVAYVEYARMLFWPSGLAAIYPHPIGGHSALRVVGSLALLLGLTAAAFGSFRRRPWLAVGWLWFLGALVPMIGLVQVGVQAWADRYALLPHVGLIVAVVWGAAAATDRTNDKFGLPTGRTAPGGGPRPATKRQIVPGVLAGLLVGGLALLSRQQTAVWQDTESLFRHALAVTENNALAHGNLGMWYVEQGRWPEAEPHLRLSLDIQPKRNKARINLANALVEAGQKKEAVRHYQAALEDEVLSARALNNLAWLLATDPDATPEMGARAAEHAERAVAWTHGEIAPMLDTLGAARAAAGDYAGAIEAGERALARTGDAALAEEIRGRLQLYRAGRPYRE